MCSSDLNEDLQRLRKRFNVGESPQDNRSLFYLSLERMKRSDELVQMRRNYGMGQAVASVNSDKGLQLMDSIRSVMKRIQTGCLHRLSKSNIDKKLMARNTLRLFLITGGLVIIFLSISCFLLLRSYRKKINYAKQLSTLNGIEIGRAHV